MNVKKFGEFLDDNCMFIFLEYMINFFFFYLVLNISNSFKECIVYK